MFPSDDATKISTDSTTLACPAKSHAEAAVATNRRDSTKDAGRVRVGMGMMRFGSTKDAGRVRVGMGMMRF